MQTRLGSKSETDFIVRHGGLLSFCMVSESGPGPRSWASGFTTYTPSQTSRPSSPKKIGCGGWEIFFCSGTARASRAGGAKWVSAAEWRSRSESRIWVSQKLAHYATATTGQKVGQKSSAPFTRSALSALRHDTAFSMTTMDAGGCELWLYHCP